MVCLDNLSENVKYLQGNVEAAISIFDSALTLEKFKEDSRALAVLYIQYARFLDQVICCPSFLARSDFHAHPVEVTNSNEMLCFWMIPKLSTVFDS